MDFAANFTAIDFETANRRSDSACQLAIVVVREGRISDSAMWMIRPKPLDFSHINVRIHGITADQVRNEPNFGGCWAEISQRIGDDCLVAHNASFDIGVLLACLRTRDQPIPELQYACTCKIARRTWPHRNRFGLKPLADWLGIRFQHHDALEDAMACAKILLAAGIDNEAKDLPDLEKKLGISRGTAGHWGRSPSGPRARRPKRPAKSANSPGTPYWTTAPSNSAADGSGDPTQSCAADSLPDLQRLMVRAEFIRPLAGRSIVFTGRLRTISREEARSLAARLGGRCQESVTAQTDLVVVGSTDRRSFEAGRSLSVKEESAHQLRSAGQSIQILNEEEFLGLVISR